MLTFALLCVAALLAVASLAVALGRAPSASPVVYAASLTASLVLLVGALVRLVADPGQVSGVTLPVGLPWLGAHFRIDALSAFFLVVVNLGALRREPVRPRLRPARDRAAAACCRSFPLFLARHEPGRARRRCLHFPRRLGVHVAVVMGAGRGAPPRSGNARAGYIYLVMASFGTLALLLAFGLLAGRTAATHSTPCAAAHPGPAVPGRRFDAGADRRRLEGRAGAAACLAAARPSRRAQPRLRADERGDDQGRGLRLHPHRLRSHRRAAHGGGASSCWRSPGSPPCSGVLYALMQHDLKRLLAYHTVENIGIIFIGLGLALAFQRNGMPGPRRWR